MKLYYETPNGKLWYGDCLDGMSHMGKVQLTLTDPPYGIFKRKDSGVMFGKPTIYSEDKTTSDWDERPKKEVFDRIKEISKNWIIFGGNYFADLLGPTKEPIVWDKRTGNNGYADGELAFTSFTGTLRIFVHQWCGAFKDSERGHRAVHPTQKPVELFSQILQKYSKEGDRILDPFLGSGTTAIACERLGRKWIGIEISEKYCEIAAKRIEAEYSQRKLF